MPTACYTICKKRNSFTNIIRRALAGDQEKRVSIGLPQINLDAPRLLAHCFLFEIDLLLSSHLKVDFARFMDDIDIGLDSISHAKRVLRDLDLSLQTRQIRLNSGKTVIMSASQARKHFRISENKFLSKVEQTIEQKRTLGIAITKERDFLTGYIFRGLSKSQFSTGNGQKILKRLIGYCRIYSAEITSDNFNEIMINWPQLRQSLLLWWLHHPDLTKLKILSEFVTSKYIVDDLTYIDIASAVVNARLPKLLKSQFLVEQISSSLEGDQVWQLYARLWIESKYVSSISLFGTIEKNFNCWSPHEYLTRLVAGLYPRFIGDKLQPRYLGMLRRAGDRWSSSVLHFHESLSSTKEGYTSIHNMMMAKNDSLPNRLSHPKFLMLLSLLQNSAIAPTVISKLKSVHSEVANDPFYKVLLT